MHKTRTHHLFVLLGAYLGLRALLLLTSFDQISLPAYELSPMGILARIASTGWRGAPIAAYYDNCGGHLVVGLAAAPIFKLFGPSYMALKMVPLTLGVLDLLLIWDVSRRLFGARAAFIAGMAFAFGTETLVVYSLLAKGNHFEGLTLQWLATWLWVCGYQSERRSRWWMAAALCSGLAISMYFGALLWIAALALAHWLVRGRREGLRDLMGALPPLVVGLIPVLWIELSTGRPSNLAKTYVREFRPLDRLVEFSTEVLPRAAGFSDVGAISGRWASAVMLLLFVTAWAGLSSIHRARVRAPLGADADLMTSLRRRALLPFLLYLSLFVLAFVLTTPRFDVYAPPVEVGRFRYLVPHFAFSSVLFGALAGWAFQQRQAWKRSAGSIVAIAPVVLGAIFGMARVDWSFEHLGEGFVYDGYDIADASRTLMRHEVRDRKTGRLSWDFDRLRNELEGFAPSERPHIAFGLGRQLAMAQLLEKGNRKRPSIDLARILDPMPAELRDDVARGVGDALVNDHRCLRSMDRILVELQASNPDFVTFVVEGLASPMRGRLAITTPRALARSHNLGARIPRDLRVNWRKGQGQLCGALLGRGFSEDETYVREFLQEMPQAAREAFWIGAEQAWNRSRRHAEQFEVARADLEASFRSTAP